MNLARHLSALKSRKRKILSVFLTCGYPSVEVTVPLIKAMADAGADMIEIGIPFSDPISDGPVIQESSQAALSQGVTLATVFDVADKARQLVRIPLLAMGYANPTLSYGMQRFVVSCREHGICGIIIPDLPLEEAEEYRRHAASHSIASVFLAAPTTSNERLQLLDKASEGFLYCVSITGVTGSRSSGSNQRDMFLRRARENVHRNILLAGFGISTPEDAAHTASLCDGVIIGSALVRILQNSSKNDIIERAAQFVVSIRASLDH